MYSKHKKIHTITIEDNLNCFQKENNTKVNLKLQVRAPNYYVFILKLIFAKI